jgi:hypothetical protein
MNDLALNELTEFINPQFLEKFELERDHNRFRQANPFPNISFENFFKQDVLDKVLNEFPKLDSLTEVKKFDDKFSLKKISMKGEATFGPETKKLMRFLNSAPFIDFLSQLSGIEGLIPDPHFYGGGLHELPVNGFLKVHVDFHTHDFTKLDRRLNLICFLNKDWQEHFGGHLELWDQKMEKAEVKLLPIFNRVALFSTSDKSLHGNPEVVKCPVGRSRKSLALYYYTNGRPKKEISILMNNTTQFRGRDKDEEETFRSYSRIQKLRSLAKHVIPKKIVEFLKKRGI